MMSGIPLPTQFTQQPGGIQEGFNALRESSAKAKYAPYTAYSDAASKIAYANLLPYQIQAQVMSNPLMWMAMKDNPQAMQGMMDNFTKSIPQGNNVFGNIRMPSPQGDTGNGLLGMLLNKIGLGGSSNPIQNTAGVASPSSSSNAMLSGPFGQGENDNKGSPLVPATRGGVAGTAGKMTAPYNQQPFEPGKTFVDPQTGQVISAPTGSMATSLQTSINATKRVMPQLKRLSEEWEPFSTLSGQSSMQLQRGKNFLMGEKGNQNDLPTKYATFQSHLKAAPEALVKSYGLRPTNETIQRMEDVIHPYVGETGAQYQQRMLTTLKNIQDEQLGVGESQLYGGIPVGPESGKAGDTNGFDPKKMLDYHYSNADEFKEAFNSLNNQNKNLVREEMKARGWK